MIHIIKNESHVVSFAKHLIPFRTKIKKKNEKKLVYIVNLFIFAAGTRQTAQLLIFTLGGVLLLVTGFIMKLQYK